MPVCCDGLLERRRVAVAQGDDLRLLGARAKPGRWLASAIAPAPMMATPMVIRVTLQVWISGGEGVAVLSSTSRLRKR